MSDPVTKAVFEATINPIGDQVSKIEAKIDRFLEDQHHVDNKIVEIRKDVDLNAQRVKAIEKSLAWVVTTVGGAILVAIAKFLVDGGFKQ